MNEETNDTPDTLTAAPTATVHISKLSAWLDVDGEAALRACDDAAMIPGFTMQSTRDLLEAGYRLYHSADYVPDADGPESDE